MTFNPLKGYHNSFSSGEASGTFGAIPGFRTRREADFASAALRAKNYIDNQAENGAKLRALTGELSQPQQSSQSSPFGNGNDLIKAGSGLITSLLNKNSGSDFNFMDSVSMGDSLGSFAGDYGAGAFDLNQSFF